MSNSSKFIDERIEGSITSSNVPIIPVDDNQPLSFQEWLKYNNTIFTNVDDFLGRYQSYLNNWYAAKNLSKVDREAITRELYVSLIKEIILSFSSSDEKRYLRNIDFNNKRDLAIAIPFFAQKIKEICLYYSTLRDDVKTAELRYNLKGSNYGIEKIIYNEISKSLETEDLTDFIRTLNLSLSDIRNNMVINVEDLYDTYTNYFDISPNVPASAYNVVNGDRKSFFDYNVYDINPDLFIDFNSAIVQAITSYPFYLIELGDNNFSVDVRPASTQLNYLKDADFINTVNTETQSNLNLNIQREEITKFIGTDFYYLSTDSTATKFLTGELFTSLNSFANYVNKRYPAVAAIPSSNFTKTAKQIGLFFKPDKIGISTFANFGINASANLSSLKPDTVYIFPDPLKYGNVSGLSQEEFTTPLVYTENNYFNKIDFSNQYAFGDSETDPYFQIFRAYESREQTLNLGFQGLARYSDPQDFFTGDEKTVWANKDVFPIIPQNLFPIDSRIEKLYSLNKTLVQYKTDVFGNEYSLYKEVFPNKILTSDNQQSDESLKYCVTLDGYAFYDSVSGYNFDWTEYNLAKNYSGIILKTTTNIPPGTGYYYKGASYLTPSPLSAQYYNQGPPKFLLSGEIVPIISYRFQPETFCSSVIDLNFVCDTADGVTFLTPNGGQLPDVPSDIPSYDPSTQTLYYTRLIDSGASPNAPDYRPSFLNPSEFTFVPPASALTKYDGFIYLYNNTAPCGDIVLSREVTYAEESNYLNYNIPLRNTKTVPQVQGLSAKRLMYQTKFIDYGQVYFRNSNATLMVPLSTALSGIFIKYNNSIVNEINNELINFDVYYDSMQFETENYIIFDKIKFDYNTNTIENVSKTDAYFKRGDNKLFEKLSTVWFNEDDKILVFCKTRLYPLLGDTNFKIVYPEIYVVDANDLSYKKIFPVTDESQLSYYDLSYFSLSGKNINVNIVEIEKPFMTYDSETENYVISYLGKDIANVFYIFKIYFKYINGVITNVDNYMYKLLPDVFTCNFAYATVSNQYLTYLSLGTSPGSVVDGAFVFN